MTLRLRQALVILAGVMVAVMMAVLGLWQMSRFQLSVEDIAQQRAAQPPVALAPAVHADGAVDDVYGRRVVAHGAYLPEHEVVVGTSAARVVTAFRLDDGRHVAIVRGSLGDGQDTPPPPAGPRQVEGIFTASDHADDRPTGAVRLQQLAQTWPSPLVAGYVTLDAPASAAQGLSPAAAELPEQHGTAMHQGYALQWWVFAAAAIAFSLFVARQLRIHDEQRARRLRRRRAAQADLSSTPSRTG